MPVRWGYGELSCTSWDVLRIRIAKHPYLSVLTAVRDAVTHQDSGVPGPLRWRVREAMTGTVLSTLEPLGHPGRAPVSLLMPAQNPEWDVPFDQAIECARAITAAEFVGQVTELYGGTVPPAWQSAVQDPARWLSRYCDLLAAVWTAVKPFWLRAERLIDREIARVGSLAVRRTTLELLTSIMSKSTAVDERLMVRSPRAHRYEIGGSLLTIVPLMTSVGPAGHDLEYLGSGWLAYSLPELVHLCPAQSANEVDGLARPPLLAAALGDARADVLTAVTTAPIPMSDIARRVRRAPSAVTILVKALESAGFVVREREGRQVKVNLTPLGVSLRELLT
jgi:predicted transcriptional regulator